MENTYKHLTDEQKLKIEKAVTSILEALGEDTSRSGLLETPTRVANMYDEVFAGMRYTNEEIAALFDKCFEEPKAHDMVCMTGIEAFSYCEHHLALMYNMNINVAYIPKGKIIGLSKIPRIVDLVCRRLQLQERIGNDIADILGMILHTDDIMVVIKGEHSCVASRGIKKSSLTQTQTLRGVFKTDDSKRREFLGLING